MGKITKDRISIDVGANVERRTVMKQVAAAMSVGALGGSAGCQGIFQQQENGGDGGDGGDGGGDGSDGTGGDGGDGGDGGGQQNGDLPEPPDYLLVELIPPPDDLDYQSMWGERDITMVTHDASTAFFNPTIAALHDSAQALGWNANFTGPTGGHNVEEQLSILESTVDAGPDVIATTITDPQAYDSVIQEALDNDIFIITYDTNALTRDEQREKFGRAFAYMGGVPFSNGYVCGLAGAERLPDDADTVTIGTCCPGHSSLQARTNGIELALRHELGADIDVNVLEYGGDAGEGVSRLENHIVSTDGLDGIIGTDAFTWFIGEAIANQGVEGEIMGGGFDLTNATLEAIQNDVLQYTIGADPYSQGYMCTSQAWIYLERGIPPKNFRTGAEVIDSSNVDVAIQRINWEPLLEFQRSNYDT